MREMRNSRRCTGGAGSLPAEKEFNAGNTKDKSVGSYPEKQASRGTAHKEARESEPVVHREEGTKKKAGRPRKQRLVSCSSQVSNIQDDTG